MVMPEEELTEFHPHHLKVKEILFSACTVMQLVVVTHGNTLMLECHTHVCVWTNETFCATNQQRY